MFKKMLWIFFLLISLACQDQNSLISLFNSKAKKIQSEYAPDLSLNVFQADLRKQNGSWVLQGETTVNEAKQAAVSYLDSLIGKDEYLDRLKLLPDSTLGDSIYGLIRISVAHLRDEPRHAAQLIDQNIMGNIVTLLKRKGGWYLIQTSYHYIGWMRRESFVRTDTNGVRAWQNHPKVKVISLFPMVYSKPDNESRPVTDVVLNAQLGLHNSGNYWTKVFTPDGRSGFIGTDDIKTDSDTAPPVETLSQSILRTAFSMTGIPYMWGGNSSKGNDCSGFTQTVFKANGIQLPRDARQQVHEGKEIIPDTSFSNVLPGDLFFFGYDGRITHVGISLGGPEFIHQSAMVHVNSLDPLAHHFSPYRQRTLKKIKRIFE